MSITRNREKLIRQIRNGSTTIDTVVPDTIDIRQEITSRVMIRAYDCQILSDHLVRKAGPITLQLETVDIELSQKGIAMKSQSVTKGTLPEIGMSMDELWEVARENSRGFMVPYYLFRWTSIPTSYFPMTKYRQNGGGVFTITLPFAWNTMALPFVMDWENSLPGLTNLIGRFRVGIRDRYIGVYPEGCYVPSGVKLLYEYDPPTGELVYVERG